MTDVSHVSFGASKPKAVSKKAALPSLSFFLQQIDTHVAVSPTVPRERSKGKHYLRWFEVPGSKAKAAIFRTPEWINKFMRFENEGKMIAYRGEEFVVVLVAYDGNTTMSFANDFLSALHKLVDKAVKKQTIKSVPTGADWDKTFLAMEEAVIKGKKPVAADHPLARFYMDSKQTFELGSTCFGFYDKEPSEVFLVSYVVKNIALGTIKETGFRGAFANLEEAERFCQWKQDTVHKYKLPDRIVPATEFSVSKV